jgi:uncharacterized protein YtpQ (UPF0354 family)
MSDWGGQDIADESPGLLRTEAPRILDPLDPDAPVSGHTPPPEPAVRGADAPEHEWTAARSRVFPLLRAADTEGVDADQAHDLSLADSLASTLPIRTPGPAGLTLVYAIAADGFAVLVNAEHLLSWGVSGADLDAAARENLAAWSTNADWSEEHEDARRLLSSSTCDGYDASRVLLPEVRARIAELATGSPGGTRILVGVPDRDLLVAAPLVPGDDGFVDLFRAFVAEQFASGSMPIAEAILELRDGELVAFDD